MLQPLADLKSQRGLPGGCRMSNVECPYNFIPRLDPSVWHSAALTAIFSVDVSSSPCNTAGFQT